MATSSIARVDALLAEKTTNLTNLGEALRQATEQLKAAHEFHVRLLAEKEAADRSVASLEQQVTSLHIETEDVRAR